MLAMHPQYQEKLYEELCSVFPQKAFTFTYEDIQELPYLNMVINETLRLQPSAPLIIRQTKENIQLDDNVRLPAGVQVVVPLFHLHRRKDIWGPMADKFNPDNFLPSNLKDKHACAFIPFSKGSRNCIGILHE